MKDRPLVSILSPCYNVEKFLPQCLDSIINQTYSNLQIVLIDDGSKDATWRVMQDYVAKDSRIEIYHQENQGVAATRNHLLDKVKGDYVLFIDSDDWIEPNMAEFLLEKALTNRADIVVCAMVKNDGACSEEYREERMDQETTIKKFLFHKELNGSLWNKLVKTSLLHGIRFDNRISYGEDALFCWHVLQRVNIVVQTDRQLYHYRMNDASISHTVFGDKKMTGYYVWKKITEDVLNNCPQYVYLARAHRAVNAMLLLRDAAHANYKKDDNIKQLQKTLRNNLFYLALYSGMKPIWFPYAILVSAMYKLGKVL